MSVKSNKKVFLCMAVSVILTVGLVAFASAAGDSADGGLWGWLKGFFGGKVGITGNAGGVSCGSLSCEVNEICFNEECVSPNTCPNGIVDLLNGGSGPMETCDPGDPNTRTTNCITTDGYAGKKTCKPDCTGYNDECTALGYCGDGTLQSSQTSPSGPEVCDGTNLNGKTCATQMGAGYTGNLVCAADCKSFVTSGCTNLPACTGYAGYTRPTDCRYYDKTSCEKPTIYKNGYYFRACAWRQSDPFGIPYSSCTNSQYDGGCSALTSQYCSMLTQCSLVNSVTGEETCKDCQWGTGGGCAGSCSYDGSCIFPPNAVGFRCSSNGQCFSDSLCTTPVGGGGGYCDWSCSYGQCTAPYCSGCAWCSGGGCNPAMCSGLDEYNCNSYPNSDYCMWSGSCVCKSSGSGSCSAKTTACVQSQEAPYCYPNLKRCQPTAYPQPSQIREICEGTGSSNDWVWDDQYGNADCTAGMHQGVCVEEQLIDPYEGPYTSTSCVECDLDGDNYQAYGTVSACHPGYPGCTQSNPNINPNQPTCDCVEVAADCSKYGAAGNAAYDYCKAHLAEIHPATYVYGTSPETANCNNGVDDDCDDLIDSADPDCVTDTTPPVSTLKIVNPADPNGASLEPDGDNGWYKHDVQWKLDAVDPGNVYGSPTLYICTDKVSPPSPGCTPTGPQLIPQYGTVDTQGTTYVRYYAVDDASPPNREYGEPGQPKVATIKIDKTAPNIVNNAPESPSFVKSPFTVSGTVTDNLMLFPFIKIKVNDGAGKDVALDGSYDTSKTFSTQLSVADGLVEGVNTITEIAKDDAGNTATKTKTVTLDTQKPTTTFWINAEPDGKKEWYKSNIVFNVQADDNSEGSGVQELYVCWDMTNSCDPAVQGGPSAAKVTVSSSPWRAAYIGLITTESSYNYVRYYAVDRAGNKEDTKSSADAPKSGGGTYGPVKLDKTAPTISNTAPPAGDSSVENAVLVISGMVGDNLMVGQTIAIKITNTGGTYSEVAALSGSDYSKSFSSLEEKLIEGMNLIEESAEDEAGNIGTVTKRVSYIDRTVPFIMLTSPAKAETYIKEGPGFTISGVVSDDNKLSTVKFNGETLDISPPGADSFSIYREVALVEGKNDFTIAATDPAGNTGLYSFAIYYDKTPPTVVDLPISSPTEQKKITISGVVIDNLPTYNDYRIKIEVNGRTLFDDVLAGGSFKVENVELNVGENTIELTATDKAGNVAPTVTRKVVYIEDNTPPLITCQEDSAGSGIITRLYASFPTSQTVSGTVSDAKSGVKSVELGEKGSGDLASIDMQDTWTYFFINKINEGLNYWFFTATDNAGNSAKCDMVIDACLDPDNDGYPDRKPSGGTP